jgi:hypothetical protein
MTNHRDNPQPAEVREAERRLYRFEASIYNGAIKPGNSSRAVALLHIDNFDNQISPCRVESNERPSHEGVTAVTERSATPLSRDGISFISELSMKPLTKSVNTFTSPEEKKATAKNLKLAVGGTIKDEARLANHEKRVDKYLEIADGSYFEIGKELAAIHAESDYPEKSFEAYVKRRWNRARDWGYKLMEGYRIKEGLPESVFSKIQSPAQVLALKAAPEDRRAEVIEAASKNGKLTVEKIEAAVGAIVTNGETKKEKKEKPQDAEFEEVDGVGIVIPKSLREEWNRADEIGKDYLSKASIIRSGLKEEDSIFGEMNGVLDTANTLYSELKQIIPYAVCPICKGKKCKVCHKRGFISKALYKNSGKE